MAFDTREIAAWLRDERETAREDARNETAEANYDNVSMPEYNYYPPF